MTPDTPPLAATAAGPRPATERGPAGTWLPSATAGLVVVVLGVLELTTRVPIAPSERLASATVVLAVGVAVGLARLAPAAALVLVWGLGALQVAAGLDVLLIELAIGAVAFACARWGRSATVWASGASIPLAAVIAVAALGVFGLEPLAQRAGLGRLVQERYAYGDTWQVAAAVVGAALLGVPWLTGLTLRFLAGARTSRASLAVAEDQAAAARREQAHAEEVARLREQQTRLAHDVHDVVGHSLAVILAQAESAQFVPGHRVEDLQRTLATIATSARTSLQDVRQVLSQPDRSAPPRPGDLDELLDGVRSSGRPLTSRVVGEPRPLPPELSAVAHRVLQEMLTNAVRHGCRGGAVEVLRRWPAPDAEGGVRIVVRNPVDVGTAGPSGATGDATPGQGIDGMRRRLASVGGELTVGPSLDGAGFEAVAVLPVRRA